MHKLKVLVCIPVQFLKASVLKIPPTQVHEIKILPHENLNKEHALSYSSSSEEEESEFDNDKVRRNDPFTEELYVSRYDDDVQNMTDEELDEHGQGRSLVVIYQIRDHRLQE